MSRTTMLKERGVSVVRYSEAGDDYPAQVECDTCGKRWLISAVDPSAKVLPIPWHCPKGCTTPGA